MWLHLLSLCPNFHGKYRSNYRPDRSSVCKAGDDVVAGQPFLQLQMTFDL